MHPSNMQAMRKHEIESLKMNIEAAGWLCDLADEKIAALRELERLQDISLKNAGHELADWTKAHLIAKLRLDRAIIAIEEFHQSVNRQNLEVMKQQLNALENPSGLVGVELGRKGLVG